MNRALWDLYRHAPAVLRVEVVNPTDLGYTGIRLVVHVPGAVKGYPKGLDHLLDGKRPRFPSPPKPLGTPTETENPLLGKWVSGASFLPAMGLPNLSRHVGRGPGYTVRDSGSVDIEYQEFELRPGQTTRLDPVPLLVGDTGVTLTATWVATAAHIRGRLTGKFDIAVTDSTLDLVALDAPDDD